MDKAQVNARMAELGLEYADPTDADIVEFSGMLDSIIEATEQAPPLERERLDPAKIAAELLADDSANLEEWNNQRVDATEHWPDFDSVTQIDGILWVLCGVCRQINCPMGWSFPVKVKSK